VQKYPTLLRQFWKERKKGKERKKEWNQNVWPNSIFNILDIIHKGQDKKRLDSHLLNRAI